MIQQKPLDAGVIISIRRPFARRSSVPLASVHWAGGFWEKRYHTLVKVTLPWLWDRMMDPDLGAIRENFLIFSGKMKGEIRGSYWHDELIHKWIEAAVYVLAYRYDAELDRKIDEAIRIVAEAQMPDGYVVASSVLHGTRFLVPRYHELYNLGHLITAACAHYQLTGKKNYLAVAIKVGDLLYDTFVPHKEKYANFSNTKSYVMAMFDLARVTGNAKYREVGNVFIDVHGAKASADSGKADQDKIHIRHGNDLIGMADDSVKIFKELEGKPLTTFEKEGIAELQGSDNRQSRVPLRDEQFVVGHAVNFTYLYTGAADAYLEEGDPRLDQALRRLWDDLTIKKMYVNGGVCPLQNGISLRGDKVGEAAGRPYELPNDNAYNETCAQIGMLMWAWRMLLASGEARFSDMMEHELYNGIIPSLGEDGISWFYMNPLRWYGEHHDLRSTKHHHMRYQPCNKGDIGHTCCPTNVTRLEAQLHGYLYTTDDDGLCVDQYASNSYSGNHPAYGAIELLQKTEYPWDGAVSFTVKKMAASCAVKLRIPSWTKGASLTLNGTPFPIDTVPGSYASVRHQWRSGDELKLNLPMPVRYTMANPKVEAARNALAVFRGPMLYCVESTDLPPGVDVAALRIPREPDFAPVSSGLFGGITALRGTLAVVEQGDYDGPLYTEWTPVQPRLIQVDLIPYYLWANRGVSSMEVWLPLL